MQSTHKLLLKEQKFLFAAVIGSVLEFFDFIIFIFLSPIIVQLFFPWHSHYYDGLLHIYLAAGTSYLFRPIGGIILGVLSDKFGRYNIFITSILCMAMSSLIVACLPTYTHIGYTATFMLIIARILQNLALGGEFPNSATYIVEKFKNFNYYILVAWLIFGANIGIIIGSQTIHLLLNYTSYKFMIAYGWRIPFFISSIIAFIAFFMRRNVTESSEFIAQNKQKISPLITLIKSYKLKMFCSTWIAFIISLSTAIFQIFLPILLVNYFAFTLTTALNLSLVGALTLAISSIFSAHLTKYFNPSSIIITAGAGLVITLGLILFSSINLNVKNDFNLDYMYGTIMVISIFLSGINGVFFGVLLNLFPSQVRCTAVSICYNVAFMLGAGLTPIWTTHLLKISGDFRYIIAVCLIILLLFFNLFKFRAKSNLAQEN